MSCDRNKPISLNVMPSAERLGSRPSWLSGLERGEGAGYYCPVGLAPPRPLPPGGAPPLACTTRQKGVPLGACLGQGPGFYTDVSSPVGCCSLFAIGSNEFVLVAHDLVSGAVTANRHSHGDCQHPACTMLLGYHWADVLLPPAAPYRAPTTLPFKANARAGGKA